ncbi:hypothetical protein HPB47_001616, partial [Ixodes persulcatus]
MLLARLLWLRRKTCPGNVLDVASFLRQDLGSIQLPKQPSGGVSSDSGRVVPSSPVQSISAARIGFSCPLGPFTSLLLDGATSPVELRIVDTLIWLRGNATEQLSYRLPIRACFLFGPWAARTDSVEMAAAAEISPEQTKPETILKAFTSSPAGLTFKKEDPAAYAKMAKLIKEHAEKLRSERRCASRVDATLAALLVQMGFSEDRSVCAVNANHRSIASALDYLRGTTFEECTLCSGECSEENLKPLLTRDEWERLNRETLERYLEDDPEFRRCPAPKWRREHENVTCEAFREWKRCNDPDDPDYQAEEYIRINGIKCPNCEASFVVAKGGCAHLTCPKCKCEFCESCRSEFTKGTKCVVGEACQKKGFHAHHPRNCFFYTRDYPLEHLVNLLRHYKEYLCALVIRKNVDTVSLMNTAQMKEELRKNNLSLPEFAEGTAEDVVRARLVQAERTVGLTPDTASNDHPSAPLATLHQLLWECSARRQEREAALAKLSP